MGCGSSSLAAPDQPEMAAPADTKQRAAMGVPDEAESDNTEIGTAPQGEDEAAKIQRKKSKQSRTRRLSYVTADSVGPQPELIQPPAQGSPRGAKPATTKSNKTRARRLSLVTTGPGQTGPVPNDGAPPELQMEMGDEQSQADHVEVISAQPNVAGSGPSIESDQPIKLRVACISRAGREPGFKKTNQDNCFAFEKYITPDQALFGAFDGHGPNGHLVSGYVKQHLPIMLVQQMQEPGTDQLVNALFKSFVEINRALSTGRIDCEFSGSTAVVAFIKGRTLTTAWVGDSRGVMGRMSSEGKIEAFDLTKDHKPTMPGEKARILAANGRVDQLNDDNGEPIGPFRVWLQYSWIPGLAMSRALGDVLAHQVGVTSQPDHTVLELAEEDKFLILASDGIWEFIDSHEAVQIVARSASAEDACHQLVDEAYQRWMVEEDGVVDDITAVVVIFDHGQ